MHLHFSRITRLLFLLIVVSSVGFAYAIDTKHEEKVCADIGFKPKTEKFGSCVLELVSRRQGTSSTDLAPNANTKSDGGDGSDDDLTCQRYGLKPGAGGYAECRMKIDFARQEAIRDKERYDLELVAYNKRVAEAKREQQRQQGMRQLEMGLRMMGGQSVGDAARSVGTGTPIAPPSPPIQNQTITLPGGRPINCTTIGTVTNCR